MSLPRSLPPAAPTPLFSPLSFFAGHTIGNGVLHIALSHARAVQVTGTGFLDEAGRLTLVQRIEQAGRRPRDRTWQLRKVGSGRFAGTLSDARGPVAAEAHGNRLHVRYTATSSLDVEQWIDLQPGGDTATNNMVVRKFGIVIARLDEIIRRVRPTG